MISVIIPVYNADRFIAETIKSVLMQDEVSEIVLVDDGSTDASIAIMEKLAQNDKRIKLYTHPNHENKGRSATRNLGIMKAKNDLIAFLDADDYYLPGRFIEHLQILKDRPDLDGVYGQVAYLDWSPDQDLDRGKFRFKNKSIAIPPEKLFLAMAPIDDKVLLHANVLTLRKKVFEKFGLFNEKFEVAEDVELWSRMALASQLVFDQSKKPCAVRIIHDKNVFNLQEPYKWTKFKLLKTMLGYTLDKKFTTSERTKAFLGVIMSIGHFVKKTFRSRSAKKIPNT